MTRPSTVRLRLMLLVSRCRSPAAVQPATASLLLRSLPAVQRERVSAGKTVAAEGKGGACFCLGPAWMVHT